MNEDKLTALTYLRRLLVASELGDKSIPVKHEELLFLHKLMTTQGPSESLPEDLAKIHNQRMHKRQMEELTKSIEKALEIQNQKQEAGFFGKFDRPIF